MSLEPVPYQFRADCFQKWERTTVEKFAPSCAEDIYSGLIQCIADVPQVERIPNVSKSALMSIAEALTHRVRLDGNEVQITVNGELHHTAQASAQKACRLTRKVYKVALNNNPLVVRAYMYTGWTDLIQRALREEFLDSSVSILSRWAFNLWPDRPGTEYLTKAVKSLKDAGFKTQFTEAMGDATTGRQRQLLIVWIQTEVKSKPGSDAEPTFSVAELLRERRKLYGSKRGKAQSAPPIGSDLVEKKTIELQKIFDKLKVLSLTAPALRSWVFDLQGLDPVLAQQVTDGVGKAGYKVRLEAPFRLLSRSKKPCMKRELIVDLPLPPKG